MSGRVFSVIILGVFLFSVSTAFAEPNLVGWWELDEGGGVTAGDSSGYGNDGTITGATWFDDPCRGTCLDFNGVNDYVSVGSLESLDDLPLGDMTVCAWIHDESTLANDWGTVIGCYAYNDGWSFRTLSDANGERSLYFQAPHSGGDYAKWANFQSDYGTIVPNAWQHVAFVWDVNTKTAKLYIDGAEPSYQLINPGVGTYNSDEGNKEIGRIPHVGGIQYFEGKIDDVRIYNRTLSAGEIEELYQEGIGDLVAHWKFDEPNGVTAYDSAGDNDGTVYGANWTSGLINGALDFDGSGDYVEIANEENFDFGSDGDFTICAWIKTTATFDRRRIVNKSESGHAPYTGIEFFMDPPGIVKFRLKDNADRTIIETTATVNDGLWHFIAGVADRDGDLQIYHNGVLEDANSLALVGNIDNDIPLAIGRSMDYNGQYFDGAIDDVRIYNRALSPEEIEELYLDGIGLVAHWKLDEGSGDTAYDSAGDNDGDVYGAMWTSGLLDGALNFNGVSDYVDCGSDSSLDITDAITVGSWVKRPNFETYGLIAGKTNGDSITAGYGLFSYTEGLEFAFYSGGWQRTAPRVTVSSDEWHYVAGTYDGNNAYLYVDGEQEASVAHVGTIAAATGYSFNMSFWRPASPHYFDGIMDDVRIYDRALSAEEIRDIYISACMAVTNPAYDNWVYWGRPDCWCYARQCRGDADGLKFGNVFWVSGQDLNILKGAFSKPESSMPAGGECADLDHEKFANIFWVSGQDLNIMKQYINRPESEVPECGNPPDPNYNFWLTP